MTIVTVQIDGTHYALNHANDTVSTTVVTAGAPDFTAPSAVEAPEARMIQRAVICAEQAARMFGVVTTRA